MFALLGMRALFVVVEGLIRRFRYLHETIAVVLAVVAVKLLLEDVYEIDPVASLLLVVFCFVVGIVASLVADERDPESEAKQARARSPERARAGGGGARGTRPVTAGCRQYSSGSGSSSSSSSTISSSSSSVCPARTALTSSRSSSSSRTASSSGTSSPTRIQSPSSMSSASWAPGWAESSTTIRISVSGLK